MKACTTELLLVSDILLLNCDMQTRERFFFKIPTTNGFANGSNCTTTRTKAIGGGGGGGDEHWGECGQGASLWAESVLALWLRARIPPLDPREIPGAPSWLFQLSGVVLCTPAGVCVQAESAAHVSGWEVHIAFVVGFKLERRAARTRTRTSAKTSRSRCRACCPSQCCFVNTLSCDWMIRLVTTPYTLLCPSPNQGLPPTHSLLISSLPALCYVRPVYMSDGLGWPTLWTLESTWYLQPGTVPTQYERQQKAAVHTA